MVGKPFTKKDPRINKLGRPKDFEGVRELAREIAHEVVKDGEGDELVLNGKRVTVAEAILRKWATNKDPRYQVAFLEYAFGKVPNETKETVQTQDVVVKKLSGVSYDDL